MKKFIFVLLAIVSPAFLQAADYGLAGPANGVDTLYNRVTMQTGRDGLSFNLNGLEILIADDNSEYGDVRRRSNRRYDRRRYKTTLGLIEFGFNNLSGVDYAGYPDSERYFLDIKMARSFNIAVNLVKLKAPFNRTGNVGMTVGLGIVWNDYVFMNGNTVKAVDGKLQPWFLEKEVKKSKINTFAIRVPVLIEGRTNKFFVSGGVYADLNIGSHTKYKFPKTKDKNGIYTNLFQMGITGRVGYGCVYLYGNYGLIRFFQKDKAPLAHPLSVGFGLNF